MLFAGQELGQPVLGNVGILKLIDHQVSIALLVLLAHSIAGTEQLDRLQEQIIKVHRVVSGQQFFVKMVDSSAGLIKVIVSALFQTPRIQQQTLGLGDNALHGSGMNPLGIKLGQFQSLLDHGNLIVRVIDRIVGVQANQVTVQAQQPGAEGMKGPHSKRLSPGAHQPVQSLPHFPGGLVGKSHRRNTVGASLAGPHQIGDSMGDYPGFATARPGYDQ